MEAPPDRAAQPKTGPETDLPLLSSRIDCLDLPLQEDSQTGWKPCHLFGGSTSCLDRVKCHVSVLSPGVSPHDIHTHRQEELLVVLSGEPDLVMLERDKSISRKKVGRGAFVYYPAFSPHTIDNTGSVPATYIMLKWSASRKTPATSPLPKTVCSLDDVSTTHRARSYSVLCEGATDYLKKLHSHVTTMAPGGGYDPHIDPYDVLIVTFEGHVETLGRHVGPHAVIFYAAGEPHGMKNIGDRAARYLVFELHNAERASSASPPQSFR